MVKQGAPHRALSRSFRHSSRIELSSPLTPWTSLSPLTLDREPSSVLEWNPDSVPDQVYLDAAAIFRDTHKDKVTAHRVISYGKRSKVTVLKVKDKVWQRRAYELAFNTLKCRHFLQLFRKDPEAFPGQPRDIVSPACPGSSPRPLPGRACLEHLPRETSWRHPKQMPEPPQLSPFDVEEQWIYSKLLPGDRAPYPISKGAPRHPTEEAHFGRLYLGSYPFGHDPELMTIDQELLEDILIDSSFYSAKTVPDDLMSLVVVILYDLQDRKFLPRKQPANQEMQEEVAKVREVENCLLRFKTKLAASLARCRIKHDLLSIDCMLPESIRQRQERGSNLPIYAWINTLRTSMQEVCDVLKSAGFSHVKSITQLEGQTFCEDIQCLDLLVFPMCAKRELHKTNLLKDCRLVIQDKSCCIAPWALRPLLVPDGDVVMAGSFSAATVAHTAAIVTSAHTHMHTTHHSSKQARSMRVFVCGGDCTSVQRDELQGVLSSMGCSNVKLLPESLHTLDVCDTRLQKVHLILLTPQCSLSAVSNPVDYLLQENGDKELLQDLSQGYVSQSRLQTLISEQKRDLQHALRFPRVRVVVYSTCSSLPEENEDVVKSALTPTEQSRDNAKLQPFTFSRPSLLLCDKDDGSGEKKSDFFRLEASDQSNGCFLAVLTRQRQCLDKLDLEKAYDRVPREELWYCMRKSGVAEKYVRVVQDMYERSRTVVRCAVGQTEEFKVKVGLHQGSALSPFLFAIVMDQLSEEVRQESPWTMMFADDIVICSESREQVEENLERWRLALERRGMKVSRSKTEYMCVNEREGSGTVRLQGEEVKKVQEFKYLGSTVQSNGECGKEVKKRVQAGWNGWRKVLGVLCDQKISARIKGKVYRTVVRPAMLYGLETVSLRKRQESELEVAELKMLRFSLGVTRLDRIRNEYIRGTAHVGRLGDKVREARLRWFGHVQRRESEYIGRRMLDMELPGRRQRGRPKRRYMDGINEDMKLVGASVEDAEDRDRWREMIR
ncbi:hypothetical protein QTP86_024271 [Hemibagrus guttatus]|nr:hypothetical protein QTP86_024271 [Hemibagrus guttatus]